MLHDRFSLSSRGRKLLAKYEGDGPMALDGKIDRLEAALNQLLLVKPSQNQFDALLIFAAGIGLDNFRQSMTLLLFNKARFDAAADLMLRWDRINGVESEELSRRRAIERALFLEEQK